MHNYDLKKQNYDVCVSKKNDILELEKGSVDMKEESSMQFAICDDDKNFADRFINEVEKRHRQLTGCSDELLFNYFSNGTQMVNAYKSEMFDVVFMDIEVGNENGFDIARRLNQVSDDLGIVYITSHNHYVTEAFVCRPLGFIRKEKLEKDIDRALYSVDEYISKKKKMFVFMDSKKEVPILISKIIMVEVYNHDFVITTESSVFQIKDKLKRVEIELQKDGFVKISRNCMVNMRFIKDVDKKDCLLNSGDSFKISEDRVKTVKESLLKYRITH